MAVIYLRSSDGSDASDGLTWANAKATLSAALTAAGAGGTVYVSKSHAEANSLHQTFTSPGTAASPVRILCVDDTGDPEPPTALATTGTVKTNTNQRFSFGAGHAYIYGLSFTACDDGGNYNEGFQFIATTRWHWVFDQCVLYAKSVSTNAAADCISVGQANANVKAQLLELINTDLRVNNTAVGIKLAAKVIWRGGSFLAGGTNTPAKLIEPTTLNGHFARADLSGVDLSALGSGKSLISASEDCEAELVVRNCKLGASVAVASGTPTNAGGVLASLDNSDSADTNYRMERHSFQGSVVQETTIKRTGGASDGTTGISWEMADNGNAEFFSPLRSPPIAVWVDATGSKTFTVEILHDSLTNLQDDEVWLEVEYLGTAGFPLSLSASDRAADILATPANQTASSETWTTTGLTNPNKQKLAVTVTIAEIGVAFVRVCLAKGASYTVYVDPKVAVS